MSLIETSTNPDTVACEALARALANPDRDDVAAPIRAGMRARAVADACERLRLPAVLIDRVGRVLHVGRLAAPFLDGPVGVVAQHLVGRTPAARRAVERAVGAALRGEPLPRRARRLTGLSFRETSPVQRLAGLVVIGRQDRDGRRRMAALRELLAAERVSSLDNA